MNDVWARVRVRATNAEYIQIASAHKPILLQSSFFTGRTLAHAAFQSSVENVYDIKMCVQMVVARRKKTPALQR